MHYQEYLMEESCPAMCNDDISRGLPESSLVALRALACAWEQHRHQRFVAAAGAAAAPARHCECYVPPLRGHIANRRHNSVTISATTPAARCALAVAPNPTPYIAPQPRELLRHRVVQTIETAGRTQKRSLRQVQLDTAKRR